jgi:hypothetical protein
LFSEPELVHIVERWSTLSVELRKAIFRMVM